MSTLKGGVKLKNDRRDRHAHVRFGQMMTFQPESNFGFNLLSVVEPETAVSCTAFTTTKVRASQTKVQYDIDDLWSKVPASIKGADPRDTLGTAIKQGLKDFADVNRDFGLKGYYRADTGQLAPHDNVRSAMVLNQSSVMVNSYWYVEWNNTPIFGKMPIGKTKVSAHSYEILDWKIVDGETVFVIDSHQGQIRYMPFTTFDIAMQENGVSTLMPSTQAVLDQRNKTVFEYISDALKNLWIQVIKIQMAINNLKHSPEPPQSVTPAVDHYQEVKQTIMPNKIETWAKLIAQEEGDKTGVNPGNMKYTTLTKSWGATQGRPALDGGNFALFKDYQTGLTALQNFLTLGCEGQLIISHPLPCTFDAFTTRYAGNPPQGYKDAIAKGLGCEMTTDISTFLTS